MKTMDVLLVALALLLAPQVKAQETGRLDLESYCADFVNMSSSTQCHEDCADTQCFGPAVDQCYECRPPLVGIEVDVEKLCQESSVAADVRNMSDTVLNCSSESTTPAEEEEMDNRMTIIIIAAAAGGGGGVLLCCLLLVCCCCCCYCRKKRKKLYALQHNLVGGESIAEVPIVTTNTTKDRDLNTQTGGGNELKMEFNLALSDDSTVPSHDTSIVVSTSFVNHTTAGKDRVSSYETREKKGEDRPNSTASAEVTNLGIRMQLQEDHETQHQ